MFNKEEILKRTNSGLDVFKHYIPGQWRIGRNFLNPLYEDSKASCNVFFDNRNGCYRIKDFGNDDFSGDCFFYVGKLKGLDCRNSKDFIEILKVINHDLCLGFDTGETSFEATVPRKPARTTEASHKQPEQPPKIKPYSIVQQSFSEKETAFWQQYGITSEILKTYKVFSLREFKSENGEGKPFSLYSSATEPMYGYVGNSPDLNPIEMLWKKTRRNVTHNRFFNSLQELCYDLKCIGVNLEKPNQVLMKLYTFI